MAQAEAAPLSTGGAFRSFLRSLRLLRAERRVALSVAAAGGLFALMVVAEPVLFGRAINALAQGQSPLGYIGLWGALSFGSFLAGMVVSLVADRLSHRRKLAAMAQFLEHLLALPPAYHNQARAGRMMRVMINGCEALFNSWLPLLREQVTNGVLLVALLPVALMLNWRLALVLVGLLAAYVAVNLTVVRRTSGGQARVEDHYSDLSGHVGDLFANVPVLHSFLAVPNEMRAIRHSLDRLLRAQYPVLNWWAALSVLTRAASSLSIIAIFAAGSLLAARGLATIGDIVSFIGFATLMIGRLDKLTQFFADIATRAPAVAQFFAVLDERPHIVEKADAAPLRVTEGHVVFEDVTFRYPKGSGAVRGLDFEVKPGETVAIVGPTGSGKSTAIGLLQRAYDPEAGRILIDGQDIRDVTLASLRASTGVVSQDAGLFNRTIAENIAMGNPGATMAQIEAAAKLAGAHEFIMRNPEGYGRAVGDRGAGLSGGERQRIAIARAILKDAPILVLDEATSALDVGTEARLQESLDQLRKGRTTFIIAHRLSTVRDADRIIVLDGGAIVEQGSFESLIREGGVFAELARSGGLIDRDNVVPLRSEAQALARAA